MLNRAEIEATDRSGAFPATGDFVRICITDNGTGVSADDLANIFERYVHHGNASERSQGGAGLGLAFCKKAVESFGGRIWAENNGGEGSRFVILFPGITNNTTNENVNPE